MSIRILQGDCREVLATLPAESVHCCVTSPPYFGLRDYGTAQWEGGDAACDHIAGRGGNLANSSASVRGGAHKVAEAQQIPFRGECGKCGALRIDSQIGLEPTPGAYVAELVAVFREVRRVLRDDGTVWVVIGDSYAAKSLIGIPWRVAFALQADGWYLRQDIIWSKPNPMPESVTDRCTKAHEHIFLLSKRERYHFDADAIKGPDGGRPAANVNGFKKFQGAAEYHVQSGGIGSDGWEVGTGRNKRSVWTVATQPYSEAHFATFPPALIEPCILAGCPKGGTVLDPFGGAGTTGMVADRLGRNAMLIELNPEYAAMIRARVTKDAGLFAEFA